MTAHRWQVLGLNHPGTFHLPDNPTTADLAIYALRAPDCADPIEGILRSVQRELAYLGEFMVDGETLFCLGRRVEVAIALLRRAEGRDKPSAPSPSPKVEPEDEEPAVERRGGTR